jgi:ubiquitin-conjugating enzyme E2 D/E
MFYTHDNSRRIDSEFAELKNNEIDDIVSVCKKWEATIKGPKDTPYEGGIYNLDILFPKEYPFKKPIIKFTTKIYHCNIRQEDGEVGLNILLDEWCPALTISKVLLSIIVLLQEPNIKECYEPAIAKQMITDYTKFYAYAQEINQQYAVPEKVVPDNTVPDYEEKKMDDEENEPCYNEDSVVHIKTRQ